MPRTSPSQTTPSSPRRRFPSMSFFSAPASPRWNRNVPGAFQKLDIQNVSFDREERRGVSKPPKTVSMDDFAFAAMEKPGIRPLKPPPGLPSGDQYSWMKKSPMASPRSGKSPIYRGKKAFLNAFPSKTLQIDEDPFETAIENTRRSARTLSRFEDSEYPYEEGGEGDGEEVNPPDDSEVSVSSKRSSSKKWRFKNFLRFRSVGRGGN